MGISEFKKRLLWLFHDKECEDCANLGNHKKYKLEEVEIHRIKQGGNYKDHRILKVVCKKHHELYNSAQRIASGNEGSY